MPFKGNSLRQYSATYRQLRRRMATVVDCRRLFADYHKSEDEHQRAKLRIELVNSVSTVVLDVFVGAIVALIITYDPKTVFDPIRTSYLYLNNNLLQTVVAWLMGSPAGFQMNRNLVVFLGTISLTVVSYWDNLIGLLLTSPYYSIDYLVSIGLSTASILGVSVLISVLIDFSTFVFFHIFFVYVLVTRLWKLAVESIRSFTQLFGGKKINILKNRIDGYNFNFEQLILGTIFLSITIFMLPTVFVFYQSFLLLWISVLMLQNFLNLFVFIFTNFPIYLLILSVRGRLPYKESLEVVGKNEDVRLVVKSLSLAEIIGKFSNLIFSNFKTNFKIFSKIFWGNSILIRKFSEKKNSINFTNLIQNLKL
jgi:phosphatidylinositol glycan class Q protein